MTTEAGGEKSEDLSLAALPSRSRTLPPLPSSSQLPTTRAEVLPSSICPVCLNLGNEVWDPDYRERHRFGKLKITKNLRELDATEQLERRHLKPAKEVVRNAKQGCLGCEIVAWVLEPYMAQLEGKSSSIRVQMGHNENNLEWCLTYHGCVVPDKRSTYIVVSLVIRKNTYEPGKDTSSSSKDSPCPWRCIKSTSKITNYTGSPAAVRKVKNWYSDCLSNHEQCLQGIRSRLPTRIIRIAGPKKARLHISNDEIAEYACLSHCWGGQDVMKTTTSNLKQYTARLPWNRLPKTFQDAIQFTHDLGFHYLWIDSLCIIQDLIDDWRHEGSRMSEIYTNASITLAATWAATPHQGCFAIPDAKYISRTRTFRNGNHETYELHCHEELPFLEAPLHKRGWVFQERMLSRRIVHFMEQELWWECRELFTCECGTADHYTKNLGVAINMGANMTKSSSVDGIQSHWEAIVRTYTAKSLTYSSDIFPALQGLAKLVPSSMGRYLAGHWESTLIQSLCWYSIHKVRDRPKEWHAPSWSWAAAQGEVRWYRLKPDPKITACVTVLSAMTIPEGDDPMGQISYGAIVLRGRSLAGRVKETHFRYGHARYSLVLRGLQYPVTLIRHPDWDYTNQEGGMQVVALKVLMTGGTYRSVEFWLILRAVGGVVGEYVRVGILASGTAHSIRALYNEEGVEMDFKII